MRSRSRIAPASSSPSATSTAVAPSAVGCVEQRLRTLDAVLSQKRRAAGANGPATKRTLRAAPGKHVAVFHAGRLARRAAQPRRRSLAPARDPIRSRPRPPGGARPSPFQPAQSRARFRTRPLGDGAGLVEHHRVDSSRPVAARSRRAPEFRAAPARRWPRPWRSESPGSARTGTRRSARRRFAASRRVK